MEIRARRLERKAAGMSVIVVLQALACTFFLADVVGDVAVEDIGLHLVTEAFAAIGLLIAVVLGAFQAREYIAAARRDEAAVAAAQGALSELIRMRFGAWRLTPAEADVALFALKGCEVSEISRLRGSAAGTVRAQLARVYAKAGVDSHSGLIALFLEELIDLPQDLRVPEQV
jgi:DNA-binding CsgD family transcriptional regulator